MEDLLRDAICSLEGTKIYSDLQHLYSIGQDMAVAGIITEIHEDEEFGFYITVENQELKTNGKETN